MMLNDEGWSLLFILAGLLALLGAGFAWMGRERAMEDRLRAGGGALDAAAGLAVRTCGVTLLAVLPGTVYLYGLSRVGMAVSLAAGLIALECLLLPRIRRDNPGAATLPQLFAGDKRARTAFAAVSALSLLALAAGTLSLLARVFAGVFSLHYQIALAASAAMGVLLALLCGTAAVRRMDRLQVFLTLLGLIGVPVAAALTSGRQAGALASLLSGAFARMEPGRPLALDIASDALWGVGALGLAALSQRFLAVRQEHAARAGGRIGAALAALMVLLSAALGLMGRMVDGGLNGQTAAETVLVQMAGSALLRAPVKALLTAALVTTLLMGFADALRTAGSLLAWDVAQPLGAETRERPLMRVAGAASALLGLLALLLALNANVRLLAYARAGFLLSAVLGTCLLCRTFWQKRAPHAFRGLAAGTIVAAVWLALPWTRELDLLGALPACACALLLHIDWRKGESAGAQREEA